MVPLRGVDADSVRLRLEERVLRPLGRGGQPLVGESVDVHSRERRRPVAFERVRVHERYVTFDTGSVGRVGVFDTLDEPVERQRLTRVA